MEMIVIAMIWLGLFAAAFFAWYFYLQARTKERLSLIEKGADASNFYVKREKKKSFCFPWLKVGLLFAGLSIGLAGGLILITLPSMNYLYDDVGPGIVFALMFLFGGLGMILAHFTDRKKNLQD